MSSTGRLRGTLPFITPSVRVWATDFCPIGIYLKQNRPWFSFYPNYPTSSPEIFTSAIFFPSFFSYLRLYRPLSTSSWGFASKGKNPLCFGASSSSPLSPQECCSEDMTSYVREKYRWSYSVQRSLSSIFSVFWATKAKTAAAIPPFCFCPLSLSWSESCSKSRFSSSLLQALSSSVKAERTSSINWFSPAYTAELWACSSWPLRAYSDLISRFICRICYPLISAFTVRRLKECGSLKKFSMTSNIIPRS